MLTPNYGGKRPWDTSLVHTHGPSDLTEDELTMLDQMWNGDHSKSTPH